MTPDTDLMGAWMQAGIRAGLTKDEIMARVATVLGDAGYYANNGFGGLITDAINARDTRTEREKAIDAAHVNTKRF